MTDFGPLTISGTVEIQAIAVGLGGTVYSDSFYLTEGDCSDACGFPSQPTTVVGAINSAVDFGLIAAGPVQWQRSTMSTGPFTDIAGPPATVTETAANFFYRACCADNPLICSRVVTIVVG